MGNRTDSAVEANNAKNDSSAAVGAGHQTSRAGHGHLASLKLAGLKAGDGRGGGSGQESSDDSDELHIERCVSGKIGGLWVMCLEECESVSDGDDNSWRIQGRRSFLYT